MSIYISLGSNLGDREHTITKALALIGEHRDIRLLQVSALYETQPVGKTDQGWFLNAAAALTTTFSPLNLLNYLQQVEAQLGRRRLERWGPRTLDLDIILYDKLVLNSTRLTVPHPRAWQRGFVLVPMLELNPDLRFPGGTRASQLLNELEYSEQKVLFFGRLDVKI
ncbi:2-amino-4-hydroxy-6-hydroxymethyldihydropteridine diphosphokinase [Metallumcola ferriviriculae]|uniref:2-amino-4-hydroxy-6-hydroxymethyldihydropteridine diphosphokinase n=1 Tax=Metallumcola ferriviriculae TaxID=3039180 RepID=A0AAU0UIK2_9FIRM|nr:2-amino-4-hydroxy-6-hydroxymethyldihydropteridine diphosphokinase [Desulfitibacteraceae bacterium MK1]